MKFSIEGTDSIKKQVDSKINILSEMDVVASVKGEDIWNVTTQEAREKIIKQLKKSGYEVDRVEFGVIQFGEKEINNSLNYKEKSKENENARRTAFYALPSVLKRGIIAEDRGNHKGRGYGTVTIVAPIEINGLRAYIGAVVKETKGNRYKVHRVVFPREMANAGMNTAGGITTGSQPIGEVDPAINPASNKSIPTSSEKSKRKLSAVARDSAARLRAQKSPPKWAGGKSR